MLVLDHSTYRFTSSRKCDTINSARTLIILKNNGSANLLVPVRLHIGNRTNTTLDMLDLVWQRIATLGTPTATSGTPVMWGDLGAWGDGLPYFNVTASEPTYEDDPDVGADGVVGVNVKPNLSGIDIEWPNGGPIIHPGESHGLRLLTTPTSFNARLSVEWWQIGVR